MISCEFGGNSAASLELVEDFKTKANPMLEYKKYTLEKDICPKFMLEIGNPAK